MTCSDSKDIRRCGRRRRVCWIVVFLLCFYRVFLVLLLCFYRAFMVLWSCSYSALSRFHYRAHSRFCRFSKMDVFLVNRF